MELWYPIHCKDQTASDHWSRRLADDVYVRGCVYQLSSLQWENAPPLLTAPPPPSLGKFQQLSYAGDLGRRWSSLELDLPRWGAESETLTCPGTSSWHSLVASSRLMILSSTRSASRSCHYHFEWTLSWHSHLSQFEPVVQLTAVSSTARYSTFSSVWSKSYCWRCRPCFLGQAVP